MTASGTPSFLETAFAWAQQIAAALAAIHTPDPDHERPQPLVYCDLNMTPHGTRAGSRA